MPEDKQEFFKGENAEKYETKFQRLAPIKGALDLLAVAALKPAGTDARILCVGAGTGAELLAMAEEQPSWQFTVVEPSEDMMTICKAKAADAGIEERCDFHTGYLDNLPDCAPFDGATSLLVAHFITDASERQAFYAGINARLKPGALFVNAEVSVDVAAASFPTLQNAWREIMQMSDLDKDTVQKIATLDGILALPPAHVEAHMADAGFIGLCSLFQAGYMRAWRAEKA